MIHAMPVATARRARRIRRREKHPASRVVSGMILAFVGFVLLMSMSTTWFPGIDQLWPGFLVITGFGMLLSFVLTRLREPKRVLGGLVTIGIGFFLFPFALGWLDWDRMAQLWPVFPLIVGIAHFWAWIASFGRMVKHLIPGVIASGVGVVGLLFTTTPLGGWVFTMGWPVLIIVLGVGMMLWGGVAAAIVALARLAMQRI